MRGGCGGVWWGRSEGGVEEGQHFVFIGDGEIRQIDYGCPWLCGTPLMLKAL